MTVPLQTRPTAPPPKSTFQIPTIDVGPYLSNPDSAEARGIVNQVRDACVSTGFFQFVSLLLFLLLKIHTVLFQTSIIHTGRTGTKYLFLD